MLKHWLKTKMALVALVALALPLQAQAAVQVGTAAPEFTGTAADGSEVKLSDYKGKIVVLEWNNPECPFVRKHYGSGNIQSLQKDYTAKDVVWLTINSSAKGKQGYYEGEALKEQIAKDGNVATAYVTDPEGTIGKLYGAKTTPHFFIVDKDGKLAYNGAIDSVASTDPADIEKADSYVKLALDALLEGKPVATATTTPYGCGVKYSGTVGYDKK